MLIDFSFEIEDFQLGHGHMYLQEYAPDKVHLPLHLEPDFALI